MIKSRECGKQDYFSTEQRTTSCSGTNQDPLWPALAAGEHQVLDAVGYVLSKRSNKQVSLPRSGGYQVASLCGLDRNEYTGPEKSNFDDITT